MSRLLEGTPGDGGELAVMWFLGCGTSGHGGWKFSPTGKKNFRIVSVRKTDQKTIPIKTKLKGSVENAQKMLKVEKNFFNSQSKKFFSGEARNVPGKQRSYFERTNFGEAVMNFKHNLE